MDLQGHSKKNYSHEEPGQNDPSMFQTYPETSDHVCRPVVKYENNENRVSSWQSIVPPPQSIVVSQQGLEIPALLPYQPYDGLSQQLSLQLPTDQYPPVQEHFTFYAPAIDTDASNSSVASSSLSSASISPDSPSTPNNFPQSSRKLTHVCKVCGDKASGYHYGVTSCEGCKGFFRRSCYRSNDYKCLRDKMCDINKQNRNRCQYCRFKKCIEVGMARDAVRSTKTQSRQVKPVEASYDADEVVSSSTSSEPNSPGYMRLVQKLAASHSQHCGHTDMKVRGMVPKVLDMNFNEFKNGQDVRIKAWSIYSAEIVSEFENLVEFAKNIPNFLGLPSNDQVFLLKNCFFEVYLVRISRGLSQKGLLLANGKFVEIKTLKIIYGALADEMIRFSGRFIGLGINDDEIALFAASLLTTPDPNHVFDAVLFVQNLHEAILLALQRKLSDRHNIDTLLPKLSEMRQMLKKLNVMHHNELQFLRANTSSVRSMLPPLFMEVYQFGKETEHVLPEQTEVVKVEMDEEFKPFIHPYTHAASVPTEHHHIS